MIPDAAAAAASDAALELDQTVVAGGYCIGCGVCAAGPEAPFAIGFDEHGRLQATLSRAGAAEPSERSLLEICPFADAGAHEDEIGLARFGAQPGIRRDPHAGYLLRAYVGHASEGGLREVGGSGGMGTWILGELLRRDVVDAVLHVKPAGDDALFAFAVSRTPEQVAAGAKSRYYPVEMSAALAELRARPGRYAVVGVPCFIKALRRLALQDELVAERLTVTVGLFCGHLKSTAFADHIAWDYGIEPGGLRSIDFREKLPGRPANRYGVRLQGAGGVEAAGPMSDVFGYRWSYGFFKYRACDFCDDVVAETADISIGDAWLPGHLEDSRGTNVVVVRDQRLLALVEAGIEDGRLALRPLADDQVLASQRSGFRHRREGLAHRLAAADAAGVWRPRKRVAAASDGLRAADRDVFDARSELAALSHVAFRDAVAAGSPTRFRAQMTPLMARHDAAVRARRPAWRRALGRVRRIVRHGVRAARR